MFCKVKKIVFIVVSAIIFSVSVPSSYAFADDEPVKDAKKVKTTGFEGEKVEDARKRGEGGEAERDKGREKEKKDGEGKTDPVKPPPSEDQGTDGKDDDDDDDDEPCKCVLHQIEMKSVDGCILERTCGDADSCSNPRDPETGEYQKYIIGFKQVDGVMVTTKTPPLGIWGPWVGICEGDDQKSIMLEDGLSSEHGMFGGEVIYEGYEEPSDENAQYDPASEHYNSSAVHPDMHGMTQFEEERDYSFESGN